MHRLQTLRPGLADRGDADAGQVGHAHGAQHVHGVLVDLDVVDLDGRFLGQEVQAALTLLLLQNRGRRRSRSPSLGTSPTRGGIERGPSALHTETHTKTRLQLQGNAADGAPLDALHQVGGEAGDLVAQPLGLDLSDLVGRGDGTVMAESRSS